ncbi:MAG: LLM class flavin-dependent oxidoreductase [Alphaproteobacteria bacterium]|jgi:alkanesulfonate monooxygenase SsuD/methylene tetrahydromethanopterin reductase-like flavin-dependent oxidoreductase (luciferase family)
MVQELRFQVLVLPSASWDVLLERYTYVEDLGFDSVGIGDHFVDWNHPEVPWLEAWTVLAAVARETSRIRLATAVSQFPLRNPALLARQALTLDHISNGRFTLGLGTGLTIDPAYEMMGIPNWGPKERVARFREYVQAVDLMLSNEVSSFDGEYYQIKDAAMNPRPIQKPRPPLVIAALGPVMLKIAAQFADGWDSLSFAADFDDQLEETRGRIAKIDAACEAIGRDPASLHRSYLMFDAASRASGGMISYYESADLFADMVRRIVDLGISEIGLYFPTQVEQRPMFEKIAREVIPELKRSLL